MSLKSIPLLYLNLGGEMLYILDQRLRAQNIPQVLEQYEKVIIKPEFWGQPWSSIASLKSQVKWNSIYCIVSEQN